jgi:hypothetical protein
LLTFGVLKNPEPRSASTRFARSAPLRRHREARYVEGSGRPLLLELPTREERRAVNAPPRCRPEAEGRRRMTATLMASRRVHQATQAASECDPVCTTSACARGSPTDPSCRWRYSTRSIARAGSRSPPERVASRCDVLGVIMRSGVYDVQFTLAMDRSLGCRPMAGDRALQGRPTRLEARRPRDPWQPGLHSGEGRVAMERRTGSFPRHSGLRCDPAWAAIDGEAGCRAMQSGPPFMTIRSCSGPSSHCDPPQPGLHSGEGEVAMERRSGCHPRQPGVHCSQWWAAIDGKAGCRAMQMDWHS